MQQSSRSYGINISLYESDHINLCLWVRNDTFKLKQIDQIFEFSNLGSGVEIVSTSEREVTVREGEALDLFCDSTTPYQVSGECTRVQ